MSTPALILFNLVLTVVVIAVIHFAVRAFLRRNGDRTDAKNFRAKLIVFELVLAVIVIAVILLSVRALLHRNPPPTVASMMEAPSSSVSLSLMATLKVTPYSKYPFVMVAMVSSPPYM